MVWRPCGSMFDIVEDACFFAGDRGEFSGLRDAAAGWNGMTVERIPALATASKLSRANMSSVLAWSFSLSVQSDYMRRGR